MSVAIVTIEHTAVSLAVVVLKSGRSHFTSVLSTTLIRLSSQNSEQHMSSDSTHVLMDFLSKCPSKAPVIDCVTVSNGLHYQSFLPFVSNEIRTQFLGVRVDTGPM